MIDIYIDVVAILFVTWEQGAKAYRNDVTAMTKRRRNDIGTVPLRYRIRDQNDVVTTLPCYLGDVNCGQACPKKRRDCSNPVT